MSFAAARSAARVRPNDRETVPRRAEIVDDAVLRQLDRTFEMRSTRSGGSRCMSWRQFFCMRIFSTVT